MKSCSLGQAVIQWPEIIWTQRPRPGQGDRGEQVMAEAETGGRQRGDTRDRLKLPGAGKKQETTPSPTLQTARGPASALILNFSLQIYSSGPLFVALGNGHSHHGSKSSSRLSKIQSPPLGLFRDAPVLRLLRWTPMISRTRRHLSQALLLLFRLSTLKDAQLSELTLLF